MKRRSSGLLVAERAVLRVGPLHVTDAGREFFERLAMARRVSCQRGQDRPAIAGGTGSWSDAYETKLLEAPWKTALSVVNPVYGALCTVVPTDSSTGSTLTEASYTGYVRKSIASSDLASAVAGSPSSIQNANAITWAACTGSSSTVIGLAICDASTLGNVIVWATITSLLISAVQTPATIPVGSLTVTQD